MIWSVGKNCSRSTWAKIPSTKSPSKCSRNSYEKISYQIIYLLIYLSPSFLEWFKSSKVDSIIWLSCRTSVLKISNSSLAEFVWFHNPWNNHIDENRNLTCGEIEHSAWIGHHSWSWICCPQNSTAACKEWTVRGKSFIYRQVPNNWLACHLGILFSLSNSIGQSKLSGQGFGCFWLWCVVVNTGYWINTSHGQPFNDVGNFFRVSVDSSHCNCQRQENCVSYNNCIATWEIVLRINTDVACLNVGFWHVVLL